MKHTLNSLEHVSKEWSQILYFYMSKQYLWAHTILHDFCKYVAGHLELLEFKWFMVRCWHSYNTILMTSLKVSRLLYKKIYLKNLLWDEYKLFGSWKHTLFSCRCICRLYRYAWKFQIHKRALQICMIWLAKSTSMQMKMHLALTFILIILSEH